MIECQQAFSGERRQELNREERIAGRLLFYQLRERGAPFWRAAKRIRQQLPEVLRRERSKCDLGDRSASTLDRLELPHQWMGGIDFVVTIGADQQQMLQL